MPIRVGILAVQGDFEAHRQALHTLGISSLLVKKSAQLDAISALILPGGESSAMLKLLDGSFQQSLRERIAADMPVLSTCAGTILLAQTVTEPKQDSFKLLRITVERNAYGRQVDSFVSSDIELTDSGHEELDTYLQTTSGKALEGVFIRAPIIRALDSSVRVLATLKDLPVLVQQERILAATFHPELSSGSPLHRYFIEQMCS